MKLTTFSMDALVKFINGAYIENNGQIEPYNNSYLEEGSRQITKYRSYADLVKFFNNYGFEDLYKGGLPDGMTRKDYTYLRLTQINGQKHMESLINDLVSSRDFQNNPFDVDEVAEAIQRIIKYDGFKLSKHNNEYIVVGGGLVVDENVEIKPTFEDIQNEIINEIKKAKYLIWVAVAWFTDPVLFEALKQKKLEGLNIRIIVCNDDITQKYGLDYESFFETHRKNTFGAYKNIFHRKYCVIDLKTVIEGSYNWTNKAQYNDESINTIKSRETAEQYAEKFIDTLKADK